MRCSAAWRSASRDGFLGDLAGHVAVDRRKAGVDLLLGEIVEADVEARKRADMGDAAAHLPGADDADGLDLDTHSPVAPKLCRCSCWWMPGAIVRPCSSSCSSSGRMVKRSPTRP